MKKFGILLIILAGLVFLVCIVCATSAAPQELVPNQVGPFSISGTVTLMFAVGMCLLIRKLWTVSPSKEELFHQKFEEDRRADHKKLRADSLRIQRQTGWIIHKAE